MTVGLKCAACGAENPPGSGFCRQCGKAIAPPPDEEPVRVAGAGKISWGWVAAGAGLILLIQIVLSLTVTPLVIRKMVLETTNPSPNRALGVLFLIGAAVYFVVGMIVGRFSKGYTVREPAIAAVAAAAINAGFSVALDSGSFAAGSAGIVTALVVFALLAALGYGGGLVGERLQERAEKPRRPIGL